MPTPRGRRGEGDARDTDIRSRRHPQRHPFEGIWRSVNHALEAHGHATVDQDAFGQFIGPPLDRIFQTLAPGAGPPAVSALVAAFRERYSRDGYAKNVLYPGTRALLAAGTIDGDAVMIGDRHLDLEAAAANGLRGIGVTWGYGSRAELEESDPWAIVDSPEALLALLAEHPQPR